MSGPGTTPTDHAGLPRLRLPTLESVFPTLLLILAAALVVFLIRPFAGSFFTAILLACLLAPWQHRVAKRLGDRSHLAAGLLTVATLAVAILPCAWLAYAGAREVVDANQWVSETVRDEGWEGVIDALPEPLRPAADWALTKLPASSREALIGPPRTQRRSDWRSVAAFGPRDTERRAGSDRERSVSDAASGSASPRDSNSPDHSAGEGSSAGRASSTGQASSSGQGSADSKDGLLKGIDARTIGVTASFASRLFGSLVGWAVSVSMALVALYFLLSEGDRLLEYLLRVVPMPRRRSQEFVDGFRRVSTAVFKATIVSAILQTAVAMLAYVVLGLPSPVVLGLLTLAGALVPVIGAGTVCGLVGIVLALSGSTLEGIGLLLWGLIAVALLDNVAKPYLASGESEQPSSLIFFAMICGLVVFGLMGLFAGPLIVAFFVVSARLLHDARAEQDVGSSKEAIVAADPTA